MDILICLFATLWVGFLILSFRAQKNLRGLDTMEVPQGFKAPTLSIVIAVKDGAADLKSTLPRILSQGAEGPELVVVNDRSKDRTQEVIQEFQRHSPQLKSVEVKELPSGWLGKVHALNEGAKVARGEFLLFMDADIEIDKATLEKATFIAQTQRLDHLGLLPQVPPKGFFLNLMMFTSYTLFTYSARPWLEIENRPLKCVKGVGAFNLVRRSAYEKTEGFSWLKMDVADDVALAQLLAKNGGRSLLMKAGPSKPKLDWYENFGSLMRGLEKNIVGGFTNYKLSLVFLMTTFSLLTFFIPVMSLFWINHPLVLVSLVLYALASFFYAFKTKKYFSYSWPTHLALPLGIGLLGLILLRASLLCFKNKGIYWSGTFYSLRELREGVRVRLGL